MKKIGILAVLLLIGSFLSFLTVGKVSAVPGTDYYLQFQGYPFSTRERSFGPSPVPIGTLFTVAVYVENTTDAYTLYCSVQWNKNVLNLSSHYDAGIPGWVPHIYQGDWLAGYATGFLIGGVDYANGRATDITYGRMGSVPGKTGAGPGLVCTLEFEIIGFGDSTIDLYNTNILDSYGQAYWTPSDHDSTYDLTVHVLQPGPESPTVDFTWSVALLHVTFLATGTPGYDGTNICPITNYYWDWEGDGIIDLDNGNSPGPVSHDYPAEGIYTVNCTVYAPAITPNPLYYPYGMNSHNVQTKAPSFGRAIDLYTDDARYPGYTTTFTGQYAFPGTQVDSYAPQDIVILYANVTYNLEPVAHKLVTFKIKGPINAYENISFYRTAFTDLKGIAEINFTIPVPCDHFRDITFGNWTIEAKVDIVDQWVDDWHWFLVGWIVEKTDLGMGLGIGGPWDVTEFEELQTVYFKVTVKNIAMTSRNVTFTAVIYDELNVPIGSQMWVRQVPPGDSTEYLVTIYIPEWAFVGWGKVYFNCYTKDPWLCGIPYCPENAEDIKFLPGPDP